MRVLLRQQVHQKPSQWVQQHRVIPLLRIQTSEHVSTFLRLVAQLFLPVSLVLLLLSLCREHQWHRLTLLVLPQ